MRRLFVSLSLLAGAALLHSPASAQPAGAPASPPPAMSQVHGVIQAVDASSVTVTQDGAPVKVGLSDATRISTTKPIQISAIQPGSFIGTTNVDRPDGAGTSTEVHVFPPGMRMGEGHYPMPGQSAMMTNGDVTMVVAGTSGQEMDIKYSGQGGSGTRHVVVPKGTPVIAITPVDRSTLKAGTTITAFAAKTDAGLSAVAINVEGGAAP